MIFEINQECSFKSQTYSHGGSTIDTLHANQLSYSDFFEKYMINNEPCIIKNVSKDWDASHKWLKNDQINLDYLREHYGNTRVMIYNCSERYFNSQNCEVSSLTKYVDYWKVKDIEKNVYYLKDWHLKLQCSNDRFYEVPIFFASDWLNEYYIQNTNDDYRFVYMGPQGSWTPLHADVFSSYSWSTNLFGIKRWIFIPPGEEECLKDSLNNLPYDICKNNNLQNFIEIYQGPGDAIFVPSGWYHQVWNMKDTISINHNWINGCNINNVWSSLKENLKEVEKAIEDCKDMDNFEDHCQMVLDTHFGMNYTKFFNFLKFIAHSRLNMLTNPSQRFFYHDHVIGLNHIIFDLVKCKEVLMDFLKCDLNNKKHFDVENVISDIGSSIKDI